MKDATMSANIESEAERPTYTEAHVVAYPIEYIAGIDLFNEGEFHAAHDAWEDRWMGEVGASEKLFLQGKFHFPLYFHMDFLRPLVFQLLRPKYFLFLPLVIRWMRFYF